MLELLERQERLTVNQWKLVSAAILGGALGSLAVVLDGFALGVASASRQLAYAQSPLIHQSIGAGTVRGAISGAGWPIASAGGGLSLLRCWRDGGDDRQASEGAARWRCGL